MKPTVHYSERRGVAWRQPATCHSHNKLQVLKLADVTLSNRIHKIHK